MYENDYDVDVPTADELLAELGLDAYTIRKSSAPRRKARRRSLGGNRANRGAERERLSPSRHFFTLSPQGESSWHSDSTERN